MEKYCLTRLRQATRSISPIRFTASAASLDGVHQKPRLSVFDDFAAGAQIHRDNGHASGIGFCQNKSESLRDSVQVQQCSGTREQLILARYIHRPDVADRLIQVRLDLLPKVCLILDNARDEQRQPAQASDLDRQMDTLVRVNPAEENQVITAKLPGAGTTKGRFRYRPSPGNSAPERDRSC